MKSRFFWLWVAPVALLLAAFVFTLVRGSDTLYLRDVFTTHLPLKHAQAEAMRAGELPLVAPTQAGGQPLLGNLNAVPLYPDNLLYLFTPVLWAFNAHFWLHLLLAAPAFFWLGREWGLGRRGAWVAAVAWTCGGYFLSQLNFYNLVAGVTLAPAFVAAVMRAARTPAPGRRGRAAVAGLLGALLLLAGDPLLALAALLLALTAPALRPGGLARLRAAAPALALGLGAGALLALPQLVETALTTAGSFRGAYGYSARASTAASWNPLQLVEWLLPFAFGRFDLLAEGSFWGERFHTGHSPFYLSLYPGILALALAAAAGLGPRGERPRELLLRGAARWAWASAAFGLFFALGRFNPLSAWLFSLPGLRYPIKLWLLPAMGLALAAGIGFERLFGGDERRPRIAFWTVLGTLAALYAGLALTLSFAPEASEAALRRLVPPLFPASFVTAERLRLARLATVSLALAGGFALAARAALGGSAEPVARVPRRDLAAAALVVLFAASQLWLLAPLAARDAAVPYRVAPPLLEAIPPSARVAHGSFRQLFGPPTVYPGAGYPDGRALWLSRRAFHELFPYAGSLWGRGYAFNISPEGLSAFHTAVARAAVATSDDDRRLALLAASGVDLLLVDRNLDPVLEGRHALTLERTWPSFGQPLFVYRLGRTAPPLALLGRVRAAADLDAAYALLTAPGFDPRTTAVVLAAGTDAGTETAEREGEAGTVRELATGASGLTVEVDAPAGGVLVTRRAYLPRYRATVGGEPAAPRVVNLHLLGVEVPAGRHRVELWLDRRPLAAAAAGALAGAGLLLAMAIAGRRRAGIRYAAVHD